MANSLTADDLRYCRDCGEVVAAGTARQRTTHGLEEHGTAFVDYGPPEDADRLFVPLNTKPYRAFERGEKDVELRGYGDRFNMETVTPGRRVELRRGYSTDDSLWGTIRHVHHFGHLSNVPEKMDHRRIMPDATTEEFVERAADLLESYSSYVAFAVGVDRGQQ